MAALKAELEEGLGAWRRQLLAAQVKWSSRLVWSCLLVWKRLGARMRQLVAAQGGGLDGPFSSNRPLWADSI